MDTNIVSFNTRLQIKGFTLIELLIVAAIVAILAAIAVPNLLEAQTRAKVSRVKADMRSLSVGMEAYAVDNNKYPIPSTATGEMMLDPRTAVTDSVFETKTPLLLTTPVAYLSSLPIDPFIVQRRTAEARYYHCATEDFFDMRQQFGSSVNWALYWFIFFQETLGDTAPEPMEYWFQSFGPDFDHDANVPHVSASFGPHVHGNGAIYDPTNGTVSSGDIHFLGPGIGFLTSVK
jgi:prepilin-type N-terminal cleavage/methylation domain-containing protein